MKLGLVLGNEYTARMPTTARIDALIAQTRAARDLGFDGVYAGQHYVTWPLQCIQPIPLLARIAAEAGEMRLGTGIILLPLMHPVDMAEQIATLDAICGGRFIFGVGIGYEEHEFHAFGLRKQDRARRLEESLEIIKLLWTEDEVNYAGEHFTLEHVIPTTRPLASPHPPIWLAANNDPAVRRAARMGDAWLANPHARRDTLAAQIQVYREANGGTLPAEMPIMKDVFVARTHDAALAAIRPALERRYQVYVEQGQDKQMPAGDATFDLPFEELMADRFIIGDPDEVVAELRAYGAMGFTNVIAGVQPIDTDDAAALECIRLLGTEVLPHIGD